MSCNLRLTEVLSCIIINNIFYCLFRAVLEAVWCVHCASLKGAVVGTDGQAEATKRLLAACAAAKTLKRVVITSCINSVCGIIIILYELDIVYVYVFELHGLTCKLFYFLLVIM